MGRNSSGVYSLPAGNPVVSGTTISSTWANSTLTDLADAMTDSLSRSGDGGMLAPLELDSGTVGAPGLSFGAETTSGLYRIGAGEIGFAIAGSKILEVNASGLEVTGTLAVSGAFAPASLAVTGNATVGGTLGVTGATTLAGMSATTGAFSSTLSVGGVASFLAGTAALPGIAFTGDLNTGISAATADQLVLSTGGTARLTLNSVALTAGVPVFLPNGTAGNPSLAATADANTGLYFPSADELGFSLGGTGYLVGYRTVPQNEQNGNYTLVLTDSGKHIYKASGGAGETITIPANASVAFPIGTAITFVNQGGGDLSIAITSDTMTLSPDGSTGTRTLADDGVATALKVGTTAWIITGSGLT